MAEVKLEVVRMRTLLNFLIWSSWVRTAFTTRKESLGSEPEIQINQCGQIITSELIWLLTWNGIPFEDDGFNLINQDADETLFVLNYLSYLRE